MRWLYLIVAFGFATQAAAAELGSAPPWPNRHIWTLVAALAVIMLSTYAITRRRDHLRLATAMVLMASVGRTLGWALSDRPVGSVLAAAGVWTVVGSLMMIVYLKARGVRI